MTYLANCGLGPLRVCLPQKGTLFASKGHGYLGKPLLNCHDGLMPQMGSAILASRSTIKEATSKQVQPVLKKSSTKLLSSATENRQEIGLGRVGHTGSLVEPVAAGVISCNSSHLRKITLHSVSSFFGQLSEGFKGWRGRQHTLSMS